MTENERVKAVRQALGLSQQEFGSRIGIKISAMSYLESGKSRLTESNAILICKEFNVSREWLLNGAGRCSCRKVPALWMPWLRSTI
ncbi:MAG: helix-turn-helix domain-containing protein [Faecalibacterium prausnitzii]